MKLNRTTRIVIRWGLIICLVTVLSSCSSVMPQPDIPPGGPPCTNAHYHWSPTVPSVNRLHVFCGEIGYNDRPKGFHSLVNLNASQVVSGIQNIIPIGNGIYSAKVNFPAANPNNKYSSFFPNACDEDDVLNSIVYAANNPSGPAHPWGVLGPSAPAAGQGYCRGADGQSFDIHMGLLGNGNVNTAFPD